MSKYIIHNWTYVFEHCLLLFLTVNYTIPYNATIPAIDDS